MRAGLRRFVAARLSREGAAGLHLTLGLLAMMAAAWLFGALAEEVVEGSAMTALDERLAHALHRYNPVLTRAMLLITDLHSPASVLLMAALLALYFYRRRALHWLAALVLVVPGGLLVNVLLKYIFQRARPHFDDPLLTLTSYSFPSGHAAGTTLLYGLLAAYLLVNGKHWWTRGGGVLLACVMLLLVGLSRMVLGVHYLSDVVAGALGALCWLSLCITTVASWRRRRTSP